MDRLNKIEKLTYKLEESEQKYKNLFEETLGYLNDIEIKKKKIEKLAEKYKNIFDNSLIGMFLVDYKKNKILNFNKKAKELFGYTEKELKDILLCDLFANKKDYNNFIHILQNNTKNIIECRIQLKRKNNEVFWSDIKAKIYKNKEQIEGSFIEIVIPTIKERRKEDY